MDREHDAVAPKVPAVNAAQGRTEDDFSAGHRDALAEMGNISMGAAATALSHMLNKKVQITTPQVSLVSMSDVRVNYPIPCLVITVHYLEGLMGDNIFVLRENDALIIAGLIMGLEPPQKPAGLGEMELSAISEAMNQMMGSAATSMSELLDRFVNISPPKVYYQDLQKEDVNLDYLHDESVLIQIAFSIVIEDLLDSELLQLTPLSFGLHTAKHLLAELSGGAVEIEAGGAEAAAGAEAEAEVEAGAAAAAPPEDAGEEIEDEIASVVGDIVSEKAQLLQPEPEEAESRPLQPELKPEEVAPRLLQPEQEEAELAASIPDNLTADQEKEEKPIFPEIGPPVAARPGEPHGLRQEDLEKIDLIKDIPVQISVVLGKTSLPLRQVFSLSPGEVLSLENYAGEPVELLANDRLVAKGEVVLVNGKFGVRVTNIVGPKSG